MRTYLFRHLWLLMFLGSYLMMVFPISQVDAAYTSSTLRYSQKAVTYVKGYVSRLERDGYADDEILDQLINLRNIYIKREQLSLYSGRSPIEIKMIISELDNAISQYSIKAGNDYSCQYEYSCRGYSPYPGYYPYPRYPYYPGYPTPVISQEILHVNDTYFSVNTTTATETRTNISRDMSNNSYREYDMFTFVLQGNGVINQQPSPNRFLNTSLIRELSTSQNRNIRISFGAEYEQGKVRTIRSSAIGAYRTSQTAVSLSPSFTDTFYSLSPDEFYRQAVSNGYNRTYKTYKLYIARDDSQAFIVEYQETGPLGSPNAYTQNILGIDTSSFADHGSYFTHNYRIAGSTKQYKQYIYIPPRDMSISAIYAHLGIDTRMNYNIGLNRTLFVNNERTVTYINGYTVNSGYVGTVESTFSSSSSPTYLYLPASSSTFTFYPQTSYVFQNIKLSDGTYRIYRLLVATDGSEAYLTEYIENNPQYYY